MPVGGHHDGARLVAFGLGQRHAEQRPQIGPHVGLGQGHQGRQRVDALGQVLAGRLLQLAVAGGDVEDVVADLEDHAEAVPELGAGVDLGGREAAGQRPDAARRRSERRRLAADRREVVLAAAPGLEGGAHLGHLALAQAAQRVGQQFGDVDAEAGGDGGAAGQQVVAGDDGHQVPETAVDALDVAPDGRLVDHVVVVERGQVDQLDRDPAHQVVLGGARGCRRWRWPGPAGAAGACRRRRSGGS